MNNIRIPTKQINVSRKHQSINSPDYQDNLMSALVLLFTHVRQPRTIELKHRSNRNQKRKTNKNLVLEDVSIIKLMEEFLSKKDLYETYTIPQELLFLRKFFKSYAGPITFSTLYNKFHALNSSKFHKQFPEITFSNLAKHISTLTGELVSETTIVQTYITLIQFKNTFRK